MLILYIAALLPVLLLIGVLLWLDSFALIKKSNLLIAFVWGVLMAFVAGDADRILDSLIPFGLIVAPIAEESLKTVIILFFIKSKRSAFFIDNLIYGAVVGAGFGFFENIFYLRMIPDMLLGTAVMRGLGTATMHCGSVAISASILWMFQHQTGHCVRYYFIALLPAMALHTLYNAMLLPPFISLVIILFGVLSLITFLIFYNEKMMTKWMELEISEEVKLLEIMQKGEFVNSHMGKYIISIRDNFDKDKFLDIYCYIRIYLELSLRSKRNLMLKEAGLEIPNDTDFTNKVKEYQSLKKRIGKTGELALAPIVKQDNLLEWKLNNVS